jgi:hypothetical protein
VPEDVKATMKSLSDVFEQMGKPAKGRRKRTK